MENPLEPSPKAIPEVENELSNLHRYPDSNANRLKNDLVNS